MNTILKNCLAVGLGLSMLVPAVASAQTAQEIQVQQLLQEDVSSLVALNGEGAVRAYLLQLLILLTQIRNDNVNNGNNVVSGSNGDLTYTIVSGNNDNDDSEPDVETFSARDVENDRAELRGEVDMNDFRNGVAFFVYGEDEGDVKDATREDEYRDIDERGDDLQKVLLDSDIDSREDFERIVRNLDRGTRHYFALCVEYEESRNRETIKCGDIEDFITDGNGSRNDQEPDVETLNARNISDDRAQLRGEVDMNDFDNGRVFFVYGEDKDQIEDAIREDEYNDIDEDGDDLQKVIVDSDLDTRDDFTRIVTRLDDDTRHYFALCVEYEDENDRETLECGDIEQFRTDD